MGRLIETLREVEWRRLAPFIEVGLNHEEQHQELFCTDLRHAFALNPQRPAAYPGRPTRAAAAPPPMRFLEGREGVVEIVTDRLLPRLLSFEALDEGNRPIATAVAEF
jgi:hypothetical protein